MSQAEDLLNSLTEDEVAVYSVNPDAEPHIVINPDKTITVPEELKHIAVQGDHNIETVTFDCPRYWDSHDLSDMSMRIVYQRPDGHKEPHPVENLRVDETDTQMIHFDWTISGNVTPIKGNISFLVCAKLSTVEGVREREWHTRLNRDLVVDEGMDCSGDEIVEQNPDIIESILVRLDIAEQGGASDEQIAQAVTDYMSKHPVEKITEAELAAAIESYFLEHPVEGGKITDEQIADAVKEYLEANPPEVGDIVSAGTVTVTVTDRGKRPNRLMVSFMDDDCRAAVAGPDDANSLEYLIDHKQVPYTLACAPGDMVDPYKTGRFITPDDLKRMVGKGVTVSCHAYKQYNMDQFATEEAFRADLEAATALFDEWGIPVQTMSYPQGRYVDEYIPTVKEFYRMGFTVADGINEIPYASYYMHRVGLFEDDENDDGTASLADAIAWVDRLAEMESGWLIFMTHAWYKGFRPALLGDLIDYIRSDEIRSKGVEIVDIHEALDTTGNVVEAGRVEKPLADQAHPFFVVDAAGTVHTNSLKKYTNSSVKLTELKPEWHNNYFLTGEMGALKQPEVEDNNRRVSEDIEVNAGEIYRVSCSCKWDNAAYAVLPEKGAVPVDIVAGTTDDEYTTVNRDITIPEGGTILRLSCNLYAQPEGYKIYKVEYVGDREPEVPAGSVEVDPTLTKSGAAADAKVVGDALNGYVKTVNGVGPDEHGNVEIEVSSGSGSSQNVDFVVGKLESTVQTIVLDDAMYYGEINNSGQTIASDAYMYTDKIRLNETKTFSLTGLNLNGVNSHIAIRRVLAYDADGNYLRDHSILTETTGGSVSTTPTRPITMNEAVDSVVLLVYKAFQYTNKTVTMDGTEGKATYCQFAPMSVISSYDIPVLTLDGDCAGMTKDVSKNLNFTFQGMSGVAEVKLQGSSSIKTGKQIGGGFDNEIGGLYNFTIKFPEAFEAKEGWGAHTKYCFKANAIDHSHARNVCSCKLWGEIVKSRANVPAELSSLPNGGAIDGFPIVISINGKYYALGTLNIPKDGWMFGSPKAILCADAHTDATKFKALATLDGDFELEYVEDENNADWVLTSINTAIQAVLNSDGTDLDTIVGQYIDIPSAIDYYIHTVDENADDGTDKNYILVTYDGVKWYFSSYDRDTVYGLYWNGETFTSPGGGVTYAHYASVHQMMNLIYTHKKSELKARAVELRDGIKSEINVGNVFTKFATLIPAELLTQNCRRWPLLRSTNASNTTQILNWYRLRRSVIDKEIDAM